MSLNFLLPWTETNRTLNHWEFTGWERQEGSTTYYYCCHPKSGGYGWLTKWSPASA